MALASEHLHHFLKNQIEERPHQADLLERVLKYGTDLELQVNVAKEMGEPVADRRNTYTDGIDSWFSFRVPRNAATEPEWNDYRLDWSLAKYVDSIGSTGFNWAEKRSLWVGYDYDAIVGHAKGRGIEDDELARVREAVADVPWVEVRRSTGGKGLHLYIFPEDVEVANHTEHAAVARAILSILSDELAFDFESRVDVCGGNMWIWARRSTEEVQGLALLKPATEKFANLPDNWRDHVDVVTRKRSKVAMRGVDEDKEDFFSQLASSYRRVPLDETHKQIINELEALSDWDTCWVRDHYCVHTHTKALEQIAPKYKGIFKTASRGTTSSNCFMFPAKDGAFQVFRFGEGTSEAETWEHKENGKTTCWFNREPDLPTASVAHGGSETQKGGYEFPTLESALEAIKAVLPSPSMLPEMPAFLLHRQTIMKDTNNKVTIQVPKESNDPQPPKWNSTDKRGFWTLVLSTKAVDVTTTNDYDDIIRCTTTPDGQPAGWAAFTEHSGWISKSSGSIKMMLQYMGHPKPEAEQIMGQCEYRPWKLVTIPFAPEYPGNRQWNRNSPQLAIKPAMEPGEHPHWDLIYDHIGHSLNKHLHDQPWAASGREYLQAWFAALIREPQYPLPLLFLYGPEGSGKSIIHQSFSMLLTTGVRKVDKTLSNSSEFNGELEKAVLCVVDEKDIKSVKGAHNKIKECVDGQTLAIRRMRTDTYEVKNWGHWIVTGQHAHNVHLYSGDSRITGLWVGLPKKEIPRHILMQKLREESPQFLRTLLDFKLPPHTSRLRIPMIVTDEKLAATELGKDFLEMFLDEMTEPCEEGACKITFKELYGQFQSWLPSSETWSKKKVRENIPVNLQVKNGSGNVVYVTGIQWKPTSGVIS